MPAITHTKEGDWKPYDEHNRIEVMEGRMTQERLDSFKPGDFDFEMMRLTATALSAPRKRYNWWTRQYEED